MTKSKSFKWRYANMRISACEGERFSFVLLALPCMDGTWDEIAVATLGM